MEWKGSKKNNFIRLGRKFVGAITVVAAPAGWGIPHRFVAVYLDAPGISLAYSDNGAEWVEHEGNPIDARHSDTHNAIVHDPVRGTWLVHHRPGLYVGPSKRRIAVRTRHEITVPVRQVRSLWSRLRIGFRAATERSGWSGCFMTRA